MICFVNSSYKTCCKNNSQQWFSQLENEDRRYAFHEHWSSPWWLYLHLLCLVPSIDFSVLPCIPLALIPPISPVTPPRCLLPLLPLSLSFWSHLLSFPMLSLRSSLPTLKMSLEFSWNQDFLKLCLCAVCSHFNNVVYCQRSKGSSSSLEKMEVRHI